MPLALALVAGAFAGLNPCGFPMLPAFLALYVGSEERRTRNVFAAAAQGLLVGVAVTAGFLSVFALVGIPISYGLTRIMRGVPWAGLVVGTALMFTGTFIFFGRHLSLPIPMGGPMDTSRRFKAMYVFGGAYAACSLGCTLPIFLALVGAQLATKTPTEAMMVFGAYGMGSATVLVALAVGAALLRHWIARTLQRILPYVQRVSGALLTISGAYLSYYWGRVLWASPTALSRDPLIGVVSRFTSFVQTVSGTAGGRSLLLVAGLIVGAAMSASVWHWTGRARKRHDAFTTTSQSHETSGSRL